MTSTHESLVRRPLAEVRRQLLDPDRVLAALPGATLERAEDGVSGSLRLKLGTLQITYRVTIRATGPEGGSHAATIAVAGKEARGPGTLAATVDVQLDEVENGTVLRAVLDLTATGRGASVSDAAWSAAADTLLAGVVSALTDVAASNGHPVAAGAAPAGEAAATVTVPAPTGNGVAAAPPPAPRPVPLAEPSSPGAMPVAAQRPGPSPQRLAAAAALLLVLLAVLRRRRRRR